MSILEKLSEAKDLSLYKTLLLVLGDYSDKFPATGVSQLFKRALDTGMKIIPKDDRAVEILSVILGSSDSIPAKVQKLLNLRFADLDYTIKPIYKNGNRKEVAFYQKDGKVNDKVLSLLHIDSQGGNWSDAKGEKVSLIDLDLVKDPN